MNLPTAALVIIAGLAALLYPKAATQPLTFEQRWEPVKQLPAMVDHSPRELTFEERWEPVKPLIQLQHKMDRLEEELQPRIIPVRTITVKQESVEVADATAETPLPAPRQKGRIIKKVSLDVCQRHGMHKVHYGRTWRCRR